MPAADSPLELASGSPEETAALGERIGRILQPGAVVALRGGLGAGKTCLARGIARGLGVAENVTSPTYTIVSEYRGRVPLYHIDAYRLAGDGDFEDLGGRELLGGEGVAIIEWSERIPRSLPQEYVGIEIIIGEGERRFFRISGLPGLEGAGLA
jgi:tRNA threonylcarbamoyladenosine biosynthesis protein TsaE